MADRGLIRGAFSAAGGDIPGYNLQAATALTNIGIGLGAAVTKEIKTRRANFEAFAEYELNRAVGLNEQEYDQKFKELSEMKRTYLLGDNQSRAKVMRQLKENKIQYDLMDETKKLFARAVTDPQSGLAMNDEFLASNTGQSLINAMKKPPVLDPSDPEGNTYGYIITDEDGQDKFVTALDIRGLVKEQSYDASTKNTFGSLMLNVADASRKITPDQDGTFNYTDYYTMVKSQFIDGKDSKQLARLYKDPSVLVQGRRFYDDLVVMIMEDDFSFIEGIDPPEYEDPDPSDGKITMLEAQTIADELLENDNLGAMYLAVYATNHLEDTWNKNASRRIGFNQNNLNNDANNGVNNDFNSNNDNDNNKKSSFFGRFRKY